MIDYKNALPGLSKHTKSFSCVSDFLITLKALNLHYDSITSMIESYELFCKFYKPQSKSQIQKDVKLEFDNLHVGDYVLSRNDTIHIIVDHANVNKFTDHMGNVFDSNGISRDTFGNVDVRLESKISLDDIVLRIMSDVDDIKSDVESLKNPMTKCDCGCNS